MLLPTLVNEEIVIIQSLVNSVKASGTQYEKIYESLILKGYLEKDSDGTIQLSDNIGGIFRPMLPSNRLVILNEFMHRNYPAVSCQNCMNRPICKVYDGILNLKVNTVIKTAVFSELASKCSFFKNTLKFYNEVQFHNEALG